MNKTTTRLVISGMLSALILVITSIKLPWLGGYIHTGDGVIFLAATILPFPYSMIAAAVGGGLADLFGGYPMWILPTVIIKAIICLPFSHKAEKFLSLRNVIALAIANPSSIVLYAIATGILNGGDNPITAALAYVPGGIAQAVGSMALFLGIGIILDKTKLKKKLSS